MLSIDCIRECYAITAGDSATCQVVHWTHCLCMCRLLALQSSLWTHCIYIGRCAELLAIVTSINSYRRPVVTDGIAWFVFVSVCRLATFLNPAKTAEPIEMPFGVAD